MNRVFELTVISVVFNLAFCIYHIVLGVTTHSWWLFTLGIYYALLSIVRFVVLWTHKKYKYIMNFTAIMLMLLSIPLVGVVILSLIRDRGIVMHEIVMIAMALYSFTKITLAIINLVKSKKSESAKLISLRNISLSESCVSIFALQRSMLVSFGDMSDVDICIFNAVVGSAVCIFIFLLGLNLILRQKKKNSEVNDQ